MNQNEFIEALGRISERLNLAPLGFAENQFSSEIRKNLDLHIKLEAFMNKLYENCAGRAFKEQFKIPDQSFFHNEIVSVLKNNLK